MIYNRKFSCCTSTSWTEKHFNFPTLVTWRSFITSRAWALAGDAAGQGAGPRGGAVGGKWLWLGATGRHTSNSLSSIPDDFGLTYHPNYSKISERAQQRGFNYFTQGYVYDTSLFPTESSGLVYHWQLEVHVEIGRAAQTPRWYRHDSQCNHRGILHLQSGVIMKIEKF